MHSSGEAHSLKVEKILFQGKSKYQNLMVFEVFFVDDYVSLFRYVVIGLVSGNISCVSVIYIWEGSCFRWSNSTYREG